MKKIEETKKELKELGFEIVRAEKTSTFAFETIVNFETILYFNRQTKQVKLYYVQDGDYVDKMEESSIEKFIERNKPSSLLEDVKRLYLLQNLNENLSNENIKKNGFKI